MNRSVTLDEHILTVIEEELSEAKRRIIARLDIPFDDEPYTDEERRQDREAITSIERGEVFSFDELKREYGL